MGLTKSNAAAAEEEKALKKTKTEEEPQPERKVILGKRVVRKKLNMDRVQCMLDVSPKPLIVPQAGPYVDPLILESFERCKEGLAFVRTRQDAMHEDLRTKGYVMGWVTDDDE